MFIDVQYDFCKGSLAIPGAEAQLPALQLFLDKAELYSLAILTGDKHPEKHSSFQAQGGPWPQHCVDGTGGQEVLLDTSTTKVPVTFVWKGTAEDGDAYSAFGNAEMDYLIRKLRITQVDICGWALDYCVKHTALDAAKRGLKTRVLLHLTSAVDPGKIDVVVQELRAAGVEVVEA